jgi:hypothetical protein
MCSAENQPASVPAEISLPLYVQRWRKQPPRERPTLVEISLPMPVTERWRTAHLPRMKEVKRWNQPTASFNDGSIPNDKAKVQLMFVPLIIYADLWDKLNGVER